MEESINFNRREKYAGKGFTALKTEKKINPKFDIHVLNLMASYVMSNNSSIRRSNLLNMRNLFLMIDRGAYMEPDKNARVEFIIRGLEARLVAGLTDPYLIIKYINGGLLDEDLLDSDNILALSNEAISWIDTTISETLKYSFMFNDMDALSDIVARFKSSDYKNIASIVKEYEELIGNIQSRFRRTRVESRSDATFSLRDGVYDESIRDIYDMITSPSSMLMSGMQGLNQMIGGGFFNGRTYMLLGLPASGKSLNLLTIAYQIKKYNKSFRAKDPTKRPCIVILTQENTVKESVERLFSISSGQKSMKDFNVDEVIRILKQDGELYINDDSPIDIIIKFKPSGSIDTGYLYTLVEDLEDEGLECICLIHDYIKHMRPVHRTGDLRIDLGQVVNEYKVFASIKDIPIIGASQLNRDGAKTIDANSGSSKTDLTRMLGRGNIGESMLILENTDCAIIINHEYDANGFKYMVYKLVKLRYAKMERDYVCQPFIVGSEIRLVEDLFMPVPMFKETLSPQRENMLNQQNQQHRTINHNNRHTVDELIERKTSSKEDNIFSNAFNSNKVRLDAPTSMMDLIPTTSSNKPIKLECPFTIKTA